MTHGLSHFPLFIEVGSQFVVFCLFVSLFIIMTVIQAQVFKIFRQRSACPNNAQAMWKLLFLLCYLSGKHGDSHDSFTPERTVLGDSANSTPSSASPALNSGLTNHLQPEEAASNSHAVKTGDNHSSSRTSLKKEPVNLTPFVTQPPAAPSPSSSTVLATPAYRGTHTSSEFKLYS